MIDVSDIDREVAEIEATLRDAEQRELEANAAIRGGPDGLSGLGAAEDAAKRVRILRARLQATKEKALDRLAGKDLPAVAPKAPLPPLVRRFTKAERRQKAVIAHPLDPSLREELSALFREHLTEDCIGAIEDEIHAAQDEAAKKGWNKAQTLTLGLYVGIVKVLARIDAEILRWGNFRCVAAVRSPPG